MAPVPRNHPALGEAFLVVVICFGWFIVSSIAAVLQGFPASAQFSDASLLSLVPMEIVLGAIALAFLRYRGYHLPYVLPSPSWRGCAEGILLCGVAIIACNVVALLLPVDRNVVQPITQIMANSKPTFGVALIVSMVNGLYEETFLLGYLTRGFAALGASFAIGLSVLVRLLYHLYQGPTGAVSVVVFGIVLAIVYRRTKRLWPAVVAHALADLSALS